MESVQNAACTQRWVKQWEEKGNMNAIGIGIAEVELARVTAMKVSDNCVMIITL